MLLRFDSKTKLCTYWHPCKN